MGTFLAGIGLCAACLVLRAVVRRWGPAHIGDEIDRIEGAALEEVDQ